MPTTKQKQPPLEVTTDQAAELLGVSSRQAVLYMIRTNKLPGARQLNPETPMSQWVIPMVAIEAYVEKKAKKKQKRAQAAMA